LSPIPRDLFEVPMTKECPHCRHPLVMNGSWFSSVSRYRCLACSNDVQLTYDEKLKLFKKYEPKPVTPG
jgi:transposase-like protein